MLTANGTCMTSGRLRVLQLSSGGEAWAERKPCKVLVCLPLVIHDVSPRPFYIPNIIIFSIRQYVKDFLGNEDFQYVKRGLLLVFICLGWLGYDSEMLGHVSEVLAHISEVLERDSEAKVYVSGVIGRISGEKVFDSEAVIYISEAKVAILEVLEPITEAKGFILEVKA